MNRLKRALYCAMVVVICANAILAFELWGVLSMMAETGIRCNPSTL